LFVSLAHSTSEEEDATILNQNLIQITARSVAATVKNELSRSSTLEEPLVSVAMNCTHISDDGIEYFCTSKKFAELQNDHCDIVVNYTYSIINRSNRKIIVETLLDESLTEIVIIDHVQGGESRKILGKKSVTDFQDTRIINICQGTSEITKKVLAITSSIKGDQFPYVHDMITIQTP
jgi:hypothetical protein